jgi:hypothetical protein
MKTPFFKLNKHKKNVTSQYGEDGIIEFLIKTSKINITKSSIEFGGHDGKSNSNTYNLWKNLGFKSLLIEGDKSRFERLKSDYDQFVSVLNCYVNIKNENSIDEIVNRTKFKEFTNLGILSVDIDSYDYHIFKHLKLKPQIIIIEFNNSIPGYIDYSDPENESFIRCSAKSLQNLGFEKGYIAVACTVTNVILLRNDCYDKNHHPNLPIEYLMDYEEMSKTNDNLYTIMHSQFYSSTPFFTKRLNRLDKLYFNLSRRLMSLFGIRKERYKTPSNNIRHKMNKSGLYF